MALGVLILSKAHRSEACMRETVIRCRAKLASRSCESDALGGDPDQARSAVRHTESFVTPPAVSCPCIVRGAWSVTL